MPEKEPRESFVQLPFVGRVAELDSFRQALIRLEVSQKGYAPILAYHGIEGSGRTRLFGEFVKICGEQEIPYVRINLDQQACETYSQNPFQIFEDIKSQLETDSSREGDDSKNLFTKLEAMTPANLLQQWEDRPQSSDAPGFYQFCDQEWLKTAGQYIKQWSGSIAEKPFVLIIDQNTVVPPLLEYWMQDFVMTFAPPKGLLVLASPRRFREPQLKRRYRNREADYQSENIFFLSELSREETIEACARVRVSQEQSQIIYRATGGFPAAVEFAVNKTKELQSSEEELVGSLGTEFLDRYIGSLEPLVKQAFLQASLVRGFDSRLLSKIAEVSDQPIEFYGDLQKKLLETGLVFWGHFFGYTIHPSLRRIADQYFQIDNPDEFRRINQAALDYYKRLLGMALDSRSLHIREALYHQARVGDEADVRTLLNEEIKRMREIIRHDDSYNKESDRLKSLITAKDSGLPEAYKDSLLKVFN